jgi:hypothetical protein
LQTFFRHKPLSSASSTDCQNPGDMKFPNAFSGPDTGNPCRNDSFRVVIFSLHRELL